MSRLSLGTRLSNLKFVPSAVLELLAFNTPKFTGSRDHDHAHFSEIFARDFYVRHFHVLQFPVLQFHVLLFHAVHIGPSISCPSFSVNPVLNIYAAFLIDSNITHCITVRPTLRYIYV